MLAGTVALTSERGGSYGFCDGTWLGTWVVQVKCHLARVWRATRSVALTGRLARHKRSESQPLPEGRASGPRRGTHAERQRSVGGGASSGAPAGSHAAPAASTRCSRQRTQAGVQPAAGTGPSRSGQARSGPAAVQAASAILRAATPLNAAAGGGIFVRRTPCEIPLEHSPKCESTGEMRGERKNTPRTRGFQP